MNAKAQIKKFKILRYDTKIRAIISWFALIYFSRVVVNYFFTGKITFLNIFVIASSTLYGLFMGIISFYGEKEEKRRISELNTMENDHKKCIQKV